MALQVGSYGVVVEFLSARFAHLAKLLRLLNAGEATPAEVGGDARGGTAAEWVEYPIAFVGRGENDARQDGERLLRGMFAAGLLPPTNGW